jgi:hypothetical protein
MIDGENLFQDDAAAMLGDKVIEMADRLRPVDRAAPGSIATYVFEMDGVTFELELRVRR